jgi:hypothetical protein
MICQWFDLKITRTIFSGLASKPVATVFSSLVSKPMTTVFSDLALKMVVTVSPGLTSKLVVSLLVPENQGEGFLSLGFKTDSIVW